jgi:drug/metabolite transporter (DMT)-like permease
MNAEALRRAGIWPTVSLAVAATAAGFNWLPLRALAREGLESGWAGFATCVLATLMMLPLMLGRGRRLDAVALSVLLTGLANGGALALYAASMLLTEVVRTLLLFYLTPMWGALLGILVLGERLTAARILAILLCLAGMAVILGNTHGWPWPHNVGDWLAILAGAVYAYGSLRVYAAHDVGARAQTFATMIGCAVVSALVLLLLPASLAGPAPSITPMLLLSVGAYALGMIIPINWLALWSAKYLTPARVGLIFALESVVGIASVALLIDEPFGWREMLGSALVIVATLIEVVGHRPPADQLEPAQREQGDMLRTQDP